MKIKYVLLGALLIALQFSLAHAAAASNGNSSTASIVNQSLNQTAQYIQTVNESGYLIFYPNLTQAYSYLNQARNESSRNATGALYLISQARRSAQQQQSRLNSDETSAAALSGIFVVLCSIALYLAMSPRKPTSKKQTR